MKSALVVLHQHPLSPQTVQLALLLLHSHQRVFVKIHLFTVQLTSHHQAFLVEGRLEAWSLADPAVAPLVLVEL